MFRCADASPHNRLTDATTPTSSMFASRTISLRRCRALRAAAQYSILCGMSLHKKHLPLQANIKMDCVPYLTSSSGFLQSTTNSYLISTPSGRQQLSLLLTPAWRNQSSYKALQLEQEDQAICRKPTNFTLSPMQFCISKLEVTSPS